MRAGLSMPALGIVVIALDEKVALGRHLPHVLPLAQELVVSDGGSTDGSAAISRALGVTVVTGSPGRGPQLNRGAEVINAEILLFLHADTLLPSSAPDLIRTAWSSGAVGGGFLLSFDNRRLRFSLAASLINARTRATRLPLGDQAQWVRRDVFHRLGGYRDWPILEDLDFARRMKRMGRVTILPASVVTASRRYATRGLFRTAFNNWLIWALFALGVSPHRLERLYPRVR
jgi:rSAM/selenodomain-associated transferase 2